MIYVEFVEIDFVFCFYYRKMLPQQTGELNVHFGVFFGGLGDFTEAYLNSVDNFRGCMSDVRKICVVNCFYFYFKNLSRFSLSNILVLFFSRCFVIFSMRAHFFVSFIDIILIWFRSMPICSIQLAIFRILY